MKVWFVISILGHIAETVGPLPYGMAECKQHVVIETAELDKKWSSVEHNPEMVVDGHQLIRSDITMDCRESETRPFIPDEINLPKGDPL